VDNRHERLRGARLYLVSDRRGERFLGQALRGGVDIVQLRIKDAPAQEVLDAARRFAPICAAHGALFILNDRPDLVAAAGADGVHLGQEDVPVDEARALLGQDRVIGLSTHTPEQVDGGNGADYIGVGPVHATPTKPGRPAVGVELVRYAASHAAVPFFAIGGIDPGNVEDVCAAGAQRVAVVRSLAEANDPESTARVLRRAVELAAAMDPGTTAEEVRVGPA
jgi:thiamine-phosphate pyrophosphorylase